MHLLSLQGLNRIRDVGMLIARGVPGVVFLYHGYKKIDGGVDGFSGFLDSQGVPLPDVFAYIVSYGELIGGLFLILGLITRIVAVAFFVEMILAVLIVKIDSGIGLISQGAPPGAELDLGLAAAMAAVAVVGPGILSVDGVAGIEGSARKSGLAA